MPVGLIGCTPISRVLQRQPTGDSVGFYLIRLAGGALPPCPPPRRTAAQLHSAARGSASWRLRGQGKPKTRPEGLA